jgi:multidrug resistance efflux pump
MNEIEILNEWSAAARLAQYQVVAPVDGEIGKVHPNPGEFVSPQSPVIILHAPITVQLNVKGARVEIIPDSNPKAKDK